MLIYAVFAVWIASGVIIRFAGVKRPKSKIERMQLRFLMRFMLFVGSVGAFGSFVVFMGSMINYSVMPMWVNVIFVSVITTLATLWWYNTFLFNYDDNLKALANDERRQTI